MAEDDDLFWEEVKDVKPLKIQYKQVITEAKKPKPRPSEINLSKMKEMHSLNH